MSDELKELEPYLAGDDVIDWQHADVLAKAREIAGNETDPTAVAKKCFEWVRDKIEHSVDYRRNPVTCAASQVLREGTGYCYAKAHLLAALLRANGIPAGLCYQRLRLDGENSPFCLHGLNGVYLEGHGWYRVDPRGNKEGVDAQFTPPTERLAFALELPGEADLPGVRPDPLPEVVNALRGFETWDALLENLPDVESGDGK